MEEAQNVVGEFGGDNRAGIEGTLHRISAIRSRKGLIVGLTCRVGRAVTGHVEMVRDLLQYKESILFLGRYIAPSFRKIKDLGTQIHFSAVLLTKFYVVVIQLLKKLLVANCDNTNETIMFRPVFLFHMGAMIIC